MRHWQSKDVSDDHHEYDVINLQQDGHAGLAIETRPDYHRKTSDMYLAYPEVAPEPERGAPVSPSPIRGTATENERVITARLAVTAGRTMN
jgi:hypothetical protein